MQFHYVAINQENQQLSGSIHAENSDNARKELNKLGFSVLSVEAIAEDSTSNPSLVSTKDNTQLKKYKFEAIDSTGKKILGTISSKDSKHGYQRLINEYHFKVNYLANIETPEHPEDLMAMAQYLESISNHTENNSDLSSPSSTVNNNNYQGVVAKEIDSILANTNSLINSYNSSFTPEAKKKLNECTDKLTRLKSSYNINYVKQSAEELLNLLTEQESFDINAINQEIKNKLSLESQKMMIKINRLNTESNNQQSLSPPALVQTTDQNNIIQPVTQTSSGDSPSLDLQTIQNQIVKNKEEIKNDLILFLKSSKENRKTLKSEIKKLWKDNKNLKNELEKLRSIKLGNKTENAQVAVQSKGILMELYYFTGWLLLFYLIYHFTAYYVWSKDILVDSSIRSVVSNPYQSSGIRNLTILLFFVHCLMSLQIKLQKETPKKLWISALSAFLISILVISNF